MSPDDPGKKYRFLHGEPEHVHTEDASLTLHPDPIPLKYDPWEGTSRQLTMADKVVHSPVYASDPGGFVTEDDEEFEEVISVQRIYALDTSATKFTEALAEAEKAIQDRDGLIQDIALIVNGSKIHGAIAWTELESVRYSQD